MKKEITDTQSLQISTDNSIRQAYLHLCANRGHKMTYKEVADEIGVSERAFSEWTRGKNQPLALQAFIRLLSNLDDHQIKSVIQAAFNTEEP